MKLHADDSNIFLFYLGDYLEDITDSLVYLKDICIENEKLLNVIGSTQEVDTLKPEGYLLKTLSKSKLLEELAKFFENQKSTLYK